MVVEESWTDKTNWWVSQ